MSRRGHYRNFNVNELAEALTRHGWQPPAANNGSYGMPNQGINGNPLPGNLSALSGLLGNMSNGGFPAVNGMNLPQNNMLSQTPPLPQGGMMPSMPGIPGMMPNRQPSPPAAVTVTQPKSVTDTELLKELFRQIMKLLKADS